MILEGFATMVLRFVEGCDFEEFSRYLPKIGQYKSEGALERFKVFIDSKLFHLIVFREDNNIIGHAIWHESNTEEHRKGDPRDKDDLDILHALLGRNKDFVELHELWLTKEHRGKGYGKKFFDYFEEYIRNKGYESLVYYAFDPAAIGICRKRGYKEGYGVSEAGPYGNTVTCYAFYLPLRKD
ncbi:MAG TPA: GNAT family N-acetyltransferase [Patescibacteria group bacterium]|nr:GNAT family N-acetyltransferase [Patescibacteria group bacterium]